MTTLLVFIFAVFFGTLAIKNFQFALSFVVFALPAYLIRFDFFGVPYTMLEVMIWVLFLVHLYFLLVQHGVSGLRRVLAHPSSEFLSLRIAMALFLVTATVALIISRDFVSGLGVWKAYFLQPILFALMVIQSTRDREDLKRIFVAMGLSVLSVFIFGVFQKFTGWKLNPIYMIDGRVDRITSFYGFPNAIGLYVAPVVAFYFGWISEFFVDFRKKLAHRECVVLFAFQLLVIVCGMVSIVLAKSEGALVGLLASLFVVGMLRARTRVVTLIVTALVILFVMVSPVYRTYAFEKLTFQGWSERVRITMWHETWQMVRDNPILGVGLSSYPVEFVKYHHAWYLEIFQYPHNIVLNFWVEMGLLGVLTFFWLVGEVCRLAYRARAMFPAVSAGLVGMIVAMIVHGLVDVPYFKNDLSVLFWVFVGVAVLTNILTEHKIFT